ncbi:DUF7657 domain-containing protein, partial [Enterococcus mundtii]
MEKQTRSARRDKSREPETEQTNLFLDILLKLRYVIGLLVIVIVVTFNLNGSSIGSWDNYVSQRDDGKNT